MESIPICSENRQQINDFLKEHWFSTDMVVRGKIFDLSKAEGFAAMEDGRITGLVTYEMRGKVCEILSLDSLTERRGIGTALVGKVSEAAKGCGCSKLVLITTNDNLNAMQFYQKRGFDMTRLYHNALDVSRKIKPEIPLIGDNGIPLKHEIEFELDLCR